MRHFFPIAWVGRSNDHAGLSPAVTGGSRDLPDHVRAHGLTRFLQDSNQVRHDPGRAIDAMAGRWVMQETKNRLFDGIVFEFSVEFDLSREQCCVPSLLEGSEIPADSVPAN